MACRSGRLSRWSVSFWKCVTTVSLLCGLARQGCHAEHGTYLCVDSVTNNTLVTGIFPNYDFAPFESPSEPNAFGLNYYNNVKCTFDLQVPTGLYIYIEFTKLVLDSSCSGDYIRLLLNPNAERTICGQPGGFIYDIYESNTAHVEFKTDEAVTNSGFSGYFSAYDPLLTKRDPGSKPRGSIDLRNPEPSGPAPQHPGSRSNAWLLNKRSATQYLHNYRYKNRHKRSALPLHNRRAMDQILQTREAIQFREDTAKQKVRLEQALQVRESYNSDTLQFMRYASSKTDIGRYCGNTCQQTKTDLIRLCRESKGLL
ncbi:uncharacterized protein LOC135805248 [Sycon ciliatum]|uniref:uncharacterized protein LOC135805248 n=1 Tax=Sycon ciliatum TaxID=27933 RepID=UPI0031F63B3C